MANSTNPVRGGNPAPDQPPPVGNPKKISAGFFSKLARALAFWKWGSSKPSNTEKPLTPEQITQIQRSKVVTSKDTYAKFRGLLRKKITIITTIATEKLAAPGLSSLEKEVYNTKIATDVPSRSLKKELTELTKNLSRDQKISLIDQVETSSNTPENRKKYSEKFIRLANDALLKWAFESDHSKSLDAYVREQVKASIKSGSLSLDTVFIHDSFKVALKGLVQFQKEAEMAGDSALSLKLAEPALSPLSKEVQNLDLITGIPSYAVRKELIDLTDNVSNDEKNHLLFSILSSLKANPESADYSGDFLLPIAEAVLSWSLKSDYSQTLDAYVKNKEPLADTSLIHQTFQFVAADLFQLRDAKLVQEPPSAALKAEFDDLTKSLAPEKQNQLAEVILNSLQTKANKEKYPEGLISIVTAALLQWAFQTDHSQPLEDYAKAYVKNLGPDFPLDTRLVYESATTLAKELLVLQKETKAISKFISLMDTAESSAEQAGFSSPLKAMINDIQTIKKIIPTAESEQLKWLIENATEEKILNVQSVVFRVLSNPGNKEKYGDDFFSKDGLNRISRMILNWMDTRPHTRSLEAYMKDSKIAIDPALIHEVFKATAQAIIQSKKQEFAQKLQQITGGDSLKDVSAKVVQSTGVTLSAALEDRLVKVFEKMESRFEASFDAIMQEANHFLANLNNNDPKHPFGIKSSLEVNNKATYLANLETEFQKEIALAITEALFPNDNGVDSLNALIGNLSLGGEIGDIKKEGLQLVGYLLPKGFSPITSYLNDAPEQNVALMRTQIENGIRSAVKGLVTSLTSPKEQQETMLNSVMPSIVDTLKRTFIGQVLNARLKTVSRLLADYSNGMTSLPDVQEEMFKLVKKHSAQMDWGDGPKAQDEFDQLLNPLLNNLLSQIEKVKEDDPIISAKKIRAIVGAFNAPPNVQVDDTTASVYMNLVTNIFTKVTKFGKCVEWLLGFEWLKKKIGQSIAVNLGDMRTSPHSILASSLDSLDNSLSESKIRSLMGADSTVVESTSTPRPLPKVEDVARRISTVTYDLALFNAQESSIFGRFAVRRLLGKNADHLTSFVAKVYDQIFEKPEKFKSLINKTIHVFADCVSGKPPVYALDVEADFVEQSTGIRSLPPLTYPAAAAAPVLSDSLPAAKNTSVKLERLHTLPATLHTFIDHLRTHIKKQFLTPQFANLADSLNGVLTPVKGFSTLLTSLNSDQSRMHLLTDLDLAQKPTKNFKTLMGALITNNPSRAQTLLGDIQTDEKITTALAGLPYPKGQKLEDYIRPVLSWLFAVDTRKVPYGLSLNDFCAKELAITSPGLKLDQNLLERVFQLHASYLNDTGLALFLEESRITLPKLLQDKTEKLLQSKTDLLLDILLERVDSLVNQIESNYTQTFDGTITALNETVIAANEASKAPKKFLAAFAQAKGCHPIIKQFLQESVGKTPAEKQKIYLELLNKHFKDTPEILVNLFFPPDSESKNGIAVLIDKLDVTGELNGFFDQVINQAYPFLTDELETSIRTNLQTLLTSFKARAVTYVHKALLEGIQKGIQSIVKTVNSEFLSQQLAVQVLPSLKNALASQMVQAVVLNAFKPPAAGFFFAGSPTRFHLLFDQAVKRFQRGDIDALYNELFETNKSAFSQSELTQEEFNQFVAPMMTKVFTQMKTKLSHEHEKLGDREEVLKIVTALFINKKEISDEAKRNINTTLGELVHSIAILGEAGTVASNASNFSIARNFLSTTISHSLVNFRLSSNTPIKLISDVLQDLMQKDEFAAGLVDTILKPKEKIETEQIDIKQELETSIKEVGKILYDFVAASSPLYKGLSALMVGGPDSFANIITNITGKLIVDNEEVLNSLVLQILDHVLPGVDS